MHTCERASVAPGREGNGAGTQAVMKQAFFSSVWAAGRGLLTGLTKVRQKREVVAFKGCCLKFGSCKSLVHVSREEIVDWMTRVLASSLGTMA